MAGDWIKIEHVTPDKPEIVTMAEILKIDQDAVFGKCFRLWAWADQQTISGNDLSVTNSFIDRVSNCPGFSSALAEVGWLKARNGKLSIPNFNRHNGQTAKNRALTKTRVEKLRNDQSVTESLPEKRREEKRRLKIKNTLTGVDASNLPPGFSDPPNLGETADRIKRVKATKTTIPSDWVIPPEVLAWCLEKNLPEPDFQLPMFINHFQSKGEARADWVATFRNWMLSPYRKDRTNGNRAGFVDQRKSAKDSREFTEKLSL